ncbi:hypothetical protein PR202_ga26674 [Eleusine coracana subsp. coracana]|uniref:Uncharacterized protein n=1 Tax=Eleusine coracana subsp. coracana TaxID=191504 RepID=A0AAV5DEP5_ELECO|nr:hypothetical protein QOZ80_3AG0237990 [Eleusine coracana subsp. coracana]GJN08721.1 hypothetical protein PR202_ga26674 [Eleusine coracana subsp. coracana]
MPSASGRRRESASAIVADKERGRHELKVDASSLAVAVPTGDGSLLKSCPFMVGGHRWHIQYYPNGNNAECKGHVSVSLVLDEDVPKPVTVEYRLGIVAETRALFFINRKEKLVSKPEIVRQFRGRESWGYSNFAKRQELFNRVRRRNVDAFTIRCDLVVRNGFRTEAAPPPPKKAARVPPSDLHKHLGDLLQSGRGADVVFEVAGERFAAHRCVLGSRSPVISAELLGAAATDDAGVVLVEGVEPRTFRALLRYAYTDALPEVDREEADGLHRELLAAADRYELERLKLICEDKLCDTIDVGTVETTLALAEKLNCHVLKETCLEFLSRPANVRAVVATRRLHPASNSRGQ